MGVDNTQERLNRRNGIIIAVIGASAVIIVAVIGFWNKSTEKPKVGILQSSVDSAAKITQEQSIKITGRVYRNKINVPFIGCIVIIKDLQNIIPEKAVDGSGLYISNSIKRSLLHTTETTLDYTIQFKYDGKIIEDKLKTISFNNKEDLASFGDVVLQYQEAKSTGTRSKARNMATGKKNTDATSKFDNRGMTNNGINIQGDSLNFKDINQIKH